LTKYYFYLKQYGFGAWNLHNILKINTINSAIVRTSLNGAAPLTISGTIALSFCSGIFLATVENYIPNEFILLKSSVRAAKFVTSVPIVIFEWTTNLFGNFIEDQILRRLHILDSPLPINVTNHFKLDVGPKVEDIPKIKKAIGQIVKTVANFRNN
jgi:hypothetical protein